MAAAAAATDLAQLELYTSDLVTAAKTLADYCRDARFASSAAAAAAAVDGGALGSAAALTPLQVIPPDAPCEVHRARRNVLANVARLQTLLAEPPDFIQRLASQTQLLACLQWLGEFQVLACVPLNGSAPARDVADLAGVPESQLCRVVRMTATAGFLREPSPGYIAHTALSAPFVTRLSYLDAAMFLAETAAPSALQMAAATRGGVGVGGQGQNSSSSAAAAAAAAANGHHQLHLLRGAGAGGGGGGENSAYKLAFNTAQTFQAAYEQRAKLQRQWPAFLRCAGDMDDGVAELLSRLDWHSLGNACIVDVDAHSTAAASALAELYPALHFVVQMSEPAALHQQQTSGREQLNPRITVQPRVPGALQTVKDAAVYILGLRAPPASSSNSPSTASSAVPGGCYGVFGGSTLHQQQMSSSSSSLSSSSSGTASASASASATAAAAAGAAPYSSGDALPLRILAELRAHLGVLRSNTAATLVLAPRLLPEPGTVDPDVEGMARVRDLSLLQLANEREMEMAELVELVESLRDSMGRLVVVNKLRSRNSATVALGVKYQSFAAADGHDADPVLL